MAKKALLPSPRWRSWRCDYRALLEIRGRQRGRRPLRAAADLHRASCTPRGDAEAARLYRRELHIAEEWGTAVIVQTMVFGNLDARSGTGRDPHPGSPTASPTPSSRYGDFVVQGQGDDVVGGLVETHPITERQRQREAARRAVSLEKDFPDDLRRARRDGPHARATTTG